MNLASETAVYAGGQLTFFPGEGCSHLIDPGRVLSPAEVVRLLSLAKRVRFFHLPKMIRSEARAVDLASKIVRVHTTTLTKTVTEAAEAHDVRFDRLQVTLLEAVGFTWACPDSTSGTTASADIRHVVPGERRQPG